MRKKQQSSGSFVCMCADCHKVRDEAGHWLQVEDISNDLGIEFTHGFCPDCLAKWQLEVDAFVLAQST